MHKYRRYDVNHDNYDAEYEQSKTAEDRHSSSPSLRLEDKRNVTNSVDKSHMYLSREKANRSIHEFSNTMQMDHSNGKSNAQN